MCAKLDGSASEEDDAVEEEDDISYACICGPATGVTAEAEACDRVGPTTLSGSDSSAGPTTSAEKEEDCEREEEARWDTDLDNCDVDEHSGRPAEAQEKARKSARYVSRSHSYSKR